MTTHPLATPSLITLAPRIAHVLAGTVAMGIGIATLLRAQVGLLPLDVLHTALAGLGGCSIGTAIIAVQGVLLTVGMALGARPGPGTLAAAVIPAVVCDHALTVLPIIDPLAPRLAMLAVGGALFAVGTAAYLGSGLGSLPRDGLMLLLHHRRGYRLAHIRITADLTCLALGTAIIGPAAATSTGALGPGSLLLALVLGPTIAQLLAWTGTIPAPPQTTPAARRRGRPRRTRHLRAGLAVCSAVLLASSGCTTAGTPTPAAGPATSGSGNAANIPDYYQAKAAAHAVARTIDPCALHDLTAARTITGHQVDELMPANNRLNQCVLRLSTGEFQATWTLYLEAGGAFDGARRRSAAPETIAGRLIYTEQADDGSGCTLARPLDDTAAITLTVRASTATPNTATTPCALGRDYLTATADRWNQPPLRSDRLTAPTLTLADLDPCDAAAALLPDFGDGAELNPSEPYQCGARPGFDTPAKRSGTQPEQITITFGVAEDPMRLVDTPSSTAEHTELAVGDRHGVASRTSSGCSTTVIWDPDTVLVADARTENPPPTYQVVTIHTETCDTAHATADKVLAKVSHR